MRTETCNTTLLALDYETFGVGAPNAAYDGFPKFGRRHTIRAHPGRQGRVPSASIIQGSLEIGLTNLVELDNRQGTVVRIIELDGRGKPNCLFVYVRERLRIERLILVEARR